MTPQEAEALEAQVSNLLTQYARALGVRYTSSTGQIVLTSAKESGSTTHTSPWLSGEM